MKMIRVGSSTASRIAQACDRCRSKKIRCDGVRPCCTQCANVGFECKTSDKLSRRAFPRGYTESLEDRVRGLEAEVRELKELLDEKDEKIDMLSRIHSFSPPSRKCSASLSPAQAVQVKAEVESTREEVLHVEIPAPVEPMATSTGSSTTASFIESFDQKLEDAGRQTTGISSSGLQNAIQLAPRNTPPGPKVPPRILSDQYISKPRPVLMLPVILFADANRSLLPGMATLDASPAPTHLLESLRTVSRESRIRQLAKQPTGICAALPHLRNRSTIQHFLTEEEHPVIRSSMAQSPLLDLLQRLPRHATMPYFGADLLHAACRLHSPCPTSWYCSHNVSRTWSSSTPQVPQLVASRG